VKRLLCIVGLIALPAVASAQQPEAVEYYATDGIGSVRIVYDANGNAIGRQDYMPFGTPVLNGTSMPKEGFVGNEKDDETQQMYFYARSLQARTGRFSSADPILDGIFVPQMWNRYAYALNNPLTLTDPSGLSVLCKTVADVHVIIRSNATTGGVIGGFNASYENCIDYGNLNPDPIPSPVPPGPPPGAPPGPGPTPPGPTPPGPTPPGPPPGPPAPPPPPKPPPPNPNCDPHNPASCGPSVAKASFYGFLEGARNSCMSLFVAETMNNAFGINPSWATSAQPAVNGVGLYQMNRSLKYASSSKVLTGTRSVVNSRLAVARNMYNVADTIVARVGPVLTEAVAMGFALKTEWDAAATGSCQGIW
jgi:RHS repeat-associated protein